TFDDRSSPQCPQCHGASRRGRKGLAAAMLVLGLCLATCVLAGAPAARQSAATGPPSFTRGGAPLAGIHYQSLPGASSTVTGSPEAQAVEILLPRPPFESWDSAEVRAEGPCLLPGMLLDPGPSLVLVATAQAVAEDDEGLSPGAGCASTLTATFDSGEEAWQAAVLVSLQRPDAPPAPEGALAVQASFSRIEALRDPRAAPSTPVPRVLLLEVTVTGTSGAPLVLHGLADPEGFAAVGGEVYELPPGVFVGSVSELQERGLEAKETTLADGESVRLALLIDAHGGLAA